MAGASQRQSTDCRDRSAAGCRRSIVRLQLTSSRIQLLAVVIDFSGVLLTGRGIGGEGNIRRARESSDNAWRIRYDRHATLQEEASLDRRRPTVWTSTEHGISRIGIRKECPFRCSAAPGVPALECLMATKPVDLTRTTLAVLSIVGLIVVSFLVVRPFLAATVWAATLVVATWPFMRRLQSAFGGRRWAAVTLMTLLLLFLVLVPLSLAVSSIATQASRLVDLPEVASACSCASTAGMAVRCSTGGSARCRKMEEPGGKQHGRHHSVGSSLCQLHHGMVYRGCRKLRRDGAAPFPDDRRRRHSLCQG